MESTDQIDCSASKLTVWADWAFPNLALAAAMLVLGFLNYALHQRFFYLAAWLPSGIAVGVVLALGYRLLPGVFAGAFGLMLAHAEDSQLALLYGVGMASAAATSRFLLNLGTPFNLRLDRVKTMLVLALVSMGVALVMSLLLSPKNALLLQYQNHHQSMITPAAALPEHAGHSPHAHPPALDEALPKNHAGGHGQVIPQSEHNRREQSTVEPLGVLLMAPLVLWFFDLRRHPPRFSFDREMLGASAIFALLLGVTLAIYSGYLERKFGLLHTTLLVLPPAVWLALTYGVGYTIVGNLAVFFIVGTGTSLGFGPFKDHSSGLDLLTVVYCVTTLMIAAGRSERLTAEAEVHRLATRDSLTKLPNRHLFDTHIERTIGSARRLQKKAAVIFIDLDHFKKVNDTLGHDIGDELLVQAAQRIQESLRADSLLSRFGGDEFIALIDNLEDTDSLQPVLKRIVEAMNTPFEIKGHACHVSCSGGLSVFPDDAQDATELLKKADIAMYQVKSSGRNGFRFYSQEMHAFLDGERR